MVWRPASTRTRVSWPSACRRAETVSGLKVLVLPYLKRNTVVWPLSEGVLPSPANLSICVVYWRHIVTGRVFLLEEYGRAQSSSVSPRGGGYCSSASTPHSSNGGSYGGGGGMNGYGGATPTSNGMLPGSPSATGGGIFNSTPSKRYYIIQMHPPRRQEKVENCFGKKKRG